jgi:hypothetical protein
MEPAPELVDCRVVTITDGGSLGTVPPTVDCHVVTITDGGSLGTAPPTAANSAPANCEGLSPLIVSDREYPTDALE